MPQRAQAYRAGQTEKVNKKTKEHSMGGNFGTLVKIASFPALYAFFCTRATHLALLISVRRAHGRYLHEEQKMQIMHRAIHAGMNKSLFMVFA